MNLLFVMCDQLRWDHLSCSGHPWLRTPNIDALAARGLRFTQAFANSGVCGPSRMSFYTGRYPVTHGATWNRVPLPVGEITLGEYLRTHGRSLALVGKTHVLPDAQGLARLQVQGELASLLERGGFEELERYDGHHEPGPESGYPDYLRANGYQSHRPWHDFVIAATDVSGHAVSGWNMRNARYAARVAEAHSETAYLTDRAIEYIGRAGERPWALHLSYVKPHWPYVAPAPYHALYRPDECLPVVRSGAERLDPHPALAAYWKHEESQSFQRDECIRTVRPAYQGLIKQIDDHLGRLLGFLDRSGRLADTVIVFTADHGDFLGDHWLGEKELFYDCVQKIPLIVVDPRSPADASRGTTCGRFVESVDLVPTVLDLLGVPLATHRLEGRSLRPLLEGEVPHDWRDFTYSELDYSFRQAREILDLQPQQARAFSLRDARWRYVRWLELPDQLYDLEADPLQMHDLGRDRAHESVRLRLRARLTDFLAARKRRTTVDDEFVRSRTNRHRQAGVLFGQW
jgi:arylsulfatase A-like enzyme